MNPINPWLDPAAVRRLAEKLITPVSRTLDAPTGDPGFDSEFVGFTPPSQATRQDLSNAAVVSPSPPAPVPPPAPAAAVPTAVSSPASPAIARGPFLERIHRFRDWLHHHFAATGVFILDREGTVIFDESGHGKLHFLARSLALTSRRPGSPAGDVHLKIGTAATLEVIPAETAFGWLVLGAVVPTAIPPTAVALVIDALNQVAAPPTAGG